MIFDVFVGFAFMSRSREQHDLALLNGVSKTFKGGHICFTGSCLAWPGSSHPRATTVKESMGAGSPIFLPQQLLRRPQKASGAPHRHQPHPKRGAEGGFFEP